MYLLLTGNAGVLLNIMVRQAPTCMPSCMTLSRRAPCSVSLSSGATHAPALLLLLWLSPLVLPYMITLARSSFYCSCSCSRWWPVWPCALGSGPTFSSLVAPRAAPACR
eukprot:scaffold1646_cov384-Prasinococcus_capsulatus_cf.AAC.4